MNHPARQVISVQTSNDIAALFRAKGYLLAKGAIPHEMMAPVKAFVLQHKARMEAQYERMRYGEFPVVPSMLPLLVPMIMRVKLIGAMQAILGGENLYVRKPTVVRCIPPQTPATLAPVHQDGAVLPEMPEFITVWIPLVEISKECEGIALYPSLGYDRELPMIETPDVDRPYIDVQGAKPVRFDMAPGDLLLFHRYMPHGSLPNTSNHDRISVDLRFFSDTSKLPKSYIDLQTGDIIPHF